MWLTRERAQYLSYAGFIISAAYTVPPLLPSIEEIQFSWYAAVTAFCAFHASAGGPIAWNIYMSGIKASNSGIVQNTQAECAGHALNYVIRAILSAGSAGLLIGMAEKHRNEFSDGAAMLHNLVLYFILWKIASLEMRPLSIECIHNMDWLFAIVDNRSHPNELDHMRAKDFLRVEEIRSS